MGKTNVDIDERLIEQAKVLLGTVSVKETIDKALREVVRMDARRQEIRALTEMDELDLGDAKVMAEAWRSCSGPATMIESVYVFAEGGTPSPPETRFLGSISRHWPRGRSRGRRTGP